MRKREKTKIEKFVGGRKGYYKELLFFLLLYGTLAIPLLKKARYWLKKKGYVVANKGYDDGDLVNWIVKILHSKAGVPIKKHKRGILNFAKNVYLTLICYMLKLFDIAKIS